MFYHKNKQGLYTVITDPTEKIDKSLRLEIDTEYENNIPNYADKKYRSKCVNLTIQIAGIGNSPSILLEHPEARSITGKSPQYPLFRYGIAVADYLEHMGYDVKVERGRFLIEEEAIEEKIPLLHLEFYAFFALAEVCRIFQGEYLTDIKRLFQQKEGKVLAEFKRRLRFSTKLGGGRTREYIIMPWYMTINGCKHQLSLGWFDTCAVHPQSSYKNFCEVSGVKLEGKELITNEEKVNMAKVYIRDRERFEKYALGDLHNYEALQGTNKKFQGIYKSLGLQEYWQPAKLTLGATTSALLTAALRKNAGVSKTDLYSLTRYGTALKLKQYGGNSAVYLSKVDGGRCINNRWGEATIKNAILVDIDISSCYGNSLVHLNYPLGIPYTIGYPMNKGINRYISLREFIEQFRDELVPGLWFLRVSTKEDYKLKYKQDLIASWYPPKNLEKYLSEYDEFDFEERWDKDEDGTSKIFTRSIHLGVITHDTLQWIQNICNPKQRKELLDNLYVIAGLVYPKSGRKNTAQEVLKVINENKDRNILELSMENGKGTKTTIETSYNYWTSFNLGDILVNGLIDIRAIEKKLRTYVDGKEVRTPEEVLVKYFINTVFGDLTSRYFKTGNVVAGNNITAKARLMCWMMEKGLYGFQSITDGCTFDINQVNYPQKRGKISGDNSANLHYQRITKNNPDIYAKPLGNQVEIKEDWITGNYLLNDGEGITSKGSKEFKEWVERQSLAHLNKLFPNIDILKNRVFSLEIKDVYHSGCFHGSSNYLLQKGRVQLWQLTLTEWAIKQKYDGLTRYNCNLLKNTLKESFKMRAYKDKPTQMYEYVEEEFQRTTLKYNPVREFLRNLLHHGNKVRRSKVFLKTTILKPGEYQQNLSHWRNTETLPGQDFHTAQLIRELNISQFPFENYEQRKQWIKQAEKWKEEYYQSYEMLYENEEGIDYLKMILDIGEKIYRGEKNFGRDKHYNLARKYHSHPEGKVLKILKKRIRDGQLGLN